MTQIVKTDIKKQVLHTFVVFGLSEVIKFLFIFFLAHAFTTEEYGYYGLIVATINICAALFDIGLVNYLRREVTTAQEEQKRRIFTSCFSAQMILLLIVSSLFYRFPFIQELGRVKAFLVTWVVFFSILMPIALSYLNYTKRIELGNNVTFIRITLWLGGVMASSLFGEVRLNGVLLWWILSYLCAFWFAFKKIGYLPIGKINGDIFRSALAFGAPLYFVELFLILLFYLDRYFLNIFTNTEVVGIYHFTYSIIFSFDRLNTKTWKGVLLPYIYEAHDHQNRERRNELITFMVKTHLLLLLLFLGVLMVGLVTVLPRVLPRAYVEHPFLFILFSMVPMIFILSYPAQIAILLQKKTNVMAFTSAIGLAVSVVLNLILIPPFSFYGAVLAMVGGFLVMGIGQYWMARGWEYLVISQFFSFEREIQIFRELMKKGFSRKTFIAIFDETDEPLYKPESDSMNQDRFPYDQAQYEEAPCSFCGNEEDFQILAHKDRDNLPARLCLCRRCGLIFISPRMTKEWYEKYYEEEYRDQLVRLKKRDFTPDFDVQFALSQKYGSVLARLVSPYLKKGLTFEVGSSVGGALSQFGKIKGGVEVFGLEPSHREAAYANQKGVKTYVSLFEDFREEIPALGNILSIRSMNHLLDPKGFLVWSHEHLEEDGRLVLVVQNFRINSKRLGRILPQIDHVYYFTPETLVTFVQAAGFEILFLEDSEYKSFWQLEKMEREGFTPEHILLVARKTNRRPFAEPFINPKIYKSLIDSLNPWRLTQYRLQFLLFRFLSRIKSFLLLLGVNLILFLLVGGGAEGVFRLFPPSDLKAVMEGRAFTHWASQHTSAEQVETPYGKIKRLKRNFSLDVHYPGIASYRVQTGEEGFRTLHVDPQKRKIFVIGDSLTFGYWVNEEESWPAILEVRLNEKYPDLQVVNTATPGHSTFDQLAVLKEVVPRYRPEMVIVGFSVGNDYYDNYQDRDLGRRLGIRLPQDEEGKAKGNSLSQILYDAQYAKPLRSFRKWLKWHSYLLNFLWLRLAPTVAAQNHWTFSYPFNPKFLKGVEWTHSAFVAMKEFLHEQNCELLVAILPTKEQIDFEHYEQDYENRRRRARWIDYRFPPRDKLPVYSQILAEVLLKEEIPYVDLYENFLRHKSKKLFFPTDFHPSKQGYRLIADEVAEYLLTKGLPLGKSRRQISASLHSES